MKNYKKLVLLCGLIAMACCVGGGVYGMLTEEEKGSIESRVKEIKGISPMFLGQLQAGVIVSWDAFKKNKGKKPVPPFDLHGVSHEMMQKFFKEFKPNMQTWLNKQLYERSTVITKLTTLFTNMMEEEFFLIGGEQVLRSKIVGFEKEIASLKKSIGELGKGVNFLRDRMIEVQQALVKRENILPGIKKDLTTGA